MAIHSIKQKLWRLKKSIIIFDNNKLISQKKYHEKGFGTNSYWHILFQRISNTSNIENNCKAVLPTIAFFVKRQATAIMDNLLLAEKMKKGPGNNQSNVSCVLRPKI